MLGFHQQPLQASLLFFHYVVCIFNLQKRKIRKINFTEFSRANNKNNINHPLEFFGI